MIAASVYTGTVIVVILPSGLRFKNISFETRCATCTPQLLWSSFDRPTPCLVNSSLILPNSRLWKDAVVSWEAICCAFMDGWRVCVQLAKDWCYVSWRVCTQSEMCVRRQTGTADNTKNTWKKWIKSVCFWTFPSPLARTFSLAYCPHSPSNTLSFPVFSVSIWHHLFLSSLAPFHLPSLSVCHCQSIHPGGKL